MAEYTYKQLGIPLDLENWEAVNDNFKTIARDLNNLSGDVLASVIDGAKLIWQEPVDTFADLATTYPDAEEGWAAMVRNTGKVYRYNGTMWLEIQQIDAAPVNEVDSRLTSQLAGTMYSSAARPTRLVAGVIRSSTGTWSPINDTNHKNINIASVSQTATQVIVSYAFTSKTVTSLIASVDETLASYGIKVGARVTQSDAKIELYMPLSAMITGATTISKAPAFLLPDLSLTPLGDGSGFILNHSKATTDDIPSVSVMREVSGDAPPVEARLAFSDTTVEVRAYKQFAGTISYSGSAWTVNTENVAKPTFSFDTATGELTVTHEKLSDYLSLSLTSRSSYRAAISSTFNDTSFKVKFYDPAGNVVLTPNTECKLIYSCGQSVRSSYPASMRVTVRRGDCLLNPANVQEPLGNIWVFGTQEIDVANI